MPAHQHLFSSFDYPSQLGIFFPLTFNALAPSWTLVGWLFLCGEEAVLPPDAVRRCKEGTKWRGKVDKHEAVK